MIYKILKVIFQIFKLEGNSEHFKIVRWEKAIPQYEANINDVHKQIERIENEQKYFFWRKLHWRNFYQTQYQQENIVKK